MKLEKIEIHNLASIGDATIDFAGAPLSDCDVFLISGATGSGKTTILDAISLALYGTTPRLRNNRMDGRVADGKDSEVLLKDPAQLMRRGTWQTWVRVSFTGNNGTAYTAEWERHRARKSPEGNLQQKSWTLKCMPPGENSFVIKGDKQIETEIRNAVGLDFDEFTRTTVLAQGQFSQFLNSSDADKAAILEKITGVDDYSRIGATIFRIAGEKKEAIQSALAEIEAIEILSDEQLAMLNEELRTCATRSEELKRRKDTKTAARDWLASLQKLESYLAVAQKKESAAAGTCASEQYSAHKTTLAQLEESSGARITLSEIRRLRKTVAVTSGKIDTSIRESAPLKSHILFLGTRLKEIGRSKDNLEKWLAAKEALRHVFEGREHSCSLAGSAIANREKARTLEKEVAGISKTAGRKKSEIAEISQKIDTATAEAEKLAKDLETLKSKEEYISLASNRKLLTTESERKFAIASLAGEYSRYLEYAETAKAKEKASKDTTRGLDELKIKHNAELRLKSAFANALDFARKNYDKAKTSLDTWACATRAGLHPGDRCPVCRQEITHPLPTDKEIYSTIVEPLEEAVKKAEETYTSAERNCNTLSAKIESTGARASEINAELRKAQLCKSEALEKLLASAAKLLPGVGPDDLGKAINHAKEGVEATLKTLAEKCRAGETIEKQVEAAGRKLNDCNATIKALHRDKDTKTSELSKTEQELAATNASLETARKVAADAAAELAARLGSYPDSVPFEPASVEFIKHLTAEANEFYARSEALAGAVRDQQSCAETQKAITRVCERIEALFPDKYASVLATTPVELPHADAKSAELFSTLSSLKASLAASQERLAELENSLSDFHSHSTISPDRLDMLSAMTEKEISACSDFISSADKALTESRSAIKTITGQINEARNLRPESLADSDTAGSLTEEISLIETESKANDLTTGAINRQIADDTVRRRKRGDLLQKINPLKTEWERWEKLNRLFGDATGRKFRSIAQSYLLGNLIHNANHYMHTLMPRYRLKGVPGTFIIMVEDAYQGYTARPASNISGGESFLVSLSLALALADIGSRLSVDTLFIDEGFGTLSGEPLRNAVETLRQLHRRGHRRVGIISHVEELRERIPVQIIVDRPPHSSRATVEISGS